MEGSTVIVRVSHFVEVPIFLSTLRYLLAFVLKIPIDMICAGAIT